MTLFEIANFKINLPFKRHANDEPMIFGPDGMLQWSGDRLGGNRVQVTRNMLAVTDWEIVCDHPVTAMSSFASRETNIGLTFGCNLCGQRVRIVKLETLPPIVPNSAPLNQEEQEQIKAAIKESVDSQWTPLTTPLPK
jgi:hypothetical protein